MVNYVMERWKGKCVVAAWYAHVLSEHITVTCITITSWSRRLHPLIDDIALVMENLILRAGRNL